MGFISYTRKVLLWSLPHSEGVTGRLRIEHLRIASPRSSDLISQPIGQWLGLPEHVGFCHFAKHQWLHHYHEHTGVDEAAAKDDGDDHGEYHAHKVIGGVAPVLPTRYVGGRTRVGGWRPRLLMMYLSASVFHAT